jgi:hypothetical protein
MMPDDTPVVGATRISNLFINSGHGTLGWTMACGSGHVIAEMISGRLPTIDTSDLSNACYDKRRNVASPYEEKGKGGCELGKKVDHHVITRPLPVRYRRCITNWTKKYETNPTDCGRCGQHPDSTT